MNPWMLGVVMAAAMMQPDSASLQPGDGAWNHEVRLATLDERGAWVESDTPVRARSTSPRILSLSGKGQAGEAGLLALYTLDLRPGEGLIVSRSLSNDGGRRWYVTPGVGFEGDTGPAIDSFCVAQLEDGRLRMYLLSKGGTQSVSPFPGLPNLPPWPTPPGPPDRPKPLPPPSVPEGPGKSDESPKAVIRSAISEDGLKFVIETGTRYESERVTSMDVMRVGDSWLMVMSRGGTIVAARSEDGLKFKDEPALRWEGAVEPALWMTPEGPRVLASTRAGIVSAVLDAKSWSIATDLGVMVSGPAGNPTAASREGGAGILLFTRFLDGRDPRW